MTAGNPTNQAPPAFHLLAKPTGAICNLDCDYCFFLSKEMLYRGSRFRMADDVLESYIRQLIDAHEAQEVTVAWQGGEPMLMGLDFFRRAIEHQRRYCRPGMTIANTIQTNGTLIDEVWAAFFRENGFLVGISIDGPRAMHDAYRRGKDGEPTFDRVVRGLELLRSHGVEFNALVSLHRANADSPLEVYRFLRDDLGIRYIQFIAIVERVVADAAAAARTSTGRSSRISWRERPLYTQRGNAVTERSITAEQYGRFLIAVFEEWVRRDVGEAYVNMFDTALANWMGEPSGSCVFSPTCGLALAMEHNGDVYSCDHFVEPRYLLGNIADTAMIDLVASPRQRTFGQDKLDALPRYCRQCTVRLACHGGCPKDRFIFTPEGEPGLNYLCAGYMAFFEHVDRPMRIMAELARSRRAPSEIIQLYAAQDAAPPENPGQTA